MMRKYIISYWLLPVTMLTAARLSNLTSSDFPMISVHITLKSASGASILDKGAVVTSQTIEQYQPAFGTVQQATKLLKSAGFEVSKSGIGLFATTSVSNFEKVLGVEITRTELKGQTIYQTEKPIRIPAGWTHVIEAIDLPDPVEYH